MGGGEKVGQKFIREYKTHWGEKKEETACDTCFFFSIRAGV